MSDFLWVLTALIANRFGTSVIGKAGRGGGGGVGQETLPVGSGGAGNVPTGSCLSAGNGES